MHLSRLLIYTICAVICSIAPVQSYKFLAILPTAYKSHFIFGSSLMKALAAKGHQVYVISAFPQKSPIENYHDVPFSFHDNDMQDNAASKKTTKTDTTELILKDRDVRRLLRSKHKFDAVICEVFYAEALFGFSEHFGAPLIGLSAHGNLAWNMDIIGSPSPSSYVPSFATEFTDHMSFFNRVVNLVSSIMEKLLANFIRLPRHAASYRKHFPLLNRDFYSVRKNITLLLVNSNDGVDYPRPYVPAQIAVGGMHIKQQRKALPADIEEFITTAEHGVVYFALGAYSDCKHFRATNTAKILKALGKLKQRVLWKLDDPVYIGQHDNVLVRSWFPQQDILAHEKVKVFITQGGMMSLTESIYHATPVIGIPVVDAQDANAAKAKNDGIGITLNYKTLTHRDIVAAVEHVVNNKRYSQRVREMSVLYKDQPMLPLDLAVYWVELVARQKGAKYLHCAGLNLNFFAYFNIDAVVIVILIGGVVPYIILERCLSRRHPGNE